MLSLAKTLLKFTPQREFPCGAHILFDQYRTISYDFYEECEYCYHNKSKILYKYYQNTRCINYEKRGEFLRLYPCRGRCREFRSGI